MRFEERVVACFQGLATSDAVGKQTETLSRTDLLKWYPGGIAGFHGRPGEVIPRYAGKRYEWRIGETTDDTEQTLAVARALLGRGDADHEAIGKELLKCSKSAHPGVSLWNFLQAGNPARMATGGDGCGAAMRSAPIGVIYPPDRFDDLVRGAFECAIPTHGGERAIAAAAAVAAAVSAALDGRSKSDVLAFAIRAASTRDSTIARSLEATYSDLSERKHPGIDEVGQRYFPDRPETIVPLAISLALITGSAEETALFAANLGGDADSVASIGGAIAGALRPESVNLRWFEVVTAINPDDIVGTAIALARIRR
jgi:ADP-ribosylglycohydrolase